METKNDLRFVPKAEPNVSAEKTRAKKKRTGSVSGQVSSLAANGPPQANFENPCDILLDIFA